MIGPKKKISIAKKHSRHSTWLSINARKLINRTNVVVCENCGGSKLWHRVCTKCGYYNGKQVLVIKTKNNVLEA